MSSKAGGGQAAAGRASVRDLVSLLGLICFVLSVGVLLWATDPAYLGTGDQRAKAAWNGGDYAVLAWVANLCLCGAVGLQLRSERIGLLPLCSLFGMMAFGVGVTVVAMAWGGERQNYWDAVHFSSLLWLSIGGALCAVVSAAIASRRGSELGSYLLGPAIVFALIVVLAWAWTWFPPLQELQADIVRSFYLGLHG